MLYLYHKYIYIGDRIVALLVGNHLGFPQVPSYL